VTATYEGKNSFFLTCGAHILDTSKELAWAEKFVVENPAHKWILGRYVEAENANANRQYFTMDNLKFGIPLLQHSPLNVNHSALKVGTFVASEIVYPTGEGAADEEDGSLNPFVEALSVFWKYYHEDLYEEVSRAYQSGSLFYSMEALPEEIGCQGDGGCGNYFEYAGRTSPTYCDHINDPHSGITKDLVKPHFMAGALIIPPVRPGWSHADIKQISELMSKNAEQAERLFSGLAEEAPDSDAEMWEQVMAQIILEAETARG
jgi:hypothetical protein